MERKKTNGSTDTDVTAKAVADKVLADVRMFNRYDMESLHAATADAMAQRILAGIYDASPTMMSTLTDKLLDKTADAMAQHMLGGMARGDWAAGPESKAREQTLMMRLVEQVLDRTSTKLAEGLFERLTEVPD